MTDSNLSAIGTGGAHGRCLRITELVSEVWRTRAQHISQRLDILLGAVAVASLIRHPHTDGHAVADLWEQGDDELLHDRLHLVWAMRWIEQPYLTQAAAPLRAWLHDEEMAPETARAIRAVIATALRAGILHLTGSEDPARRDTADLLGTVLTYMRAPGDKQKRGEYYTPPCTADLIGHMLYQWVAAAAAYPSRDLLPPNGASIADPCGGTGGLLRTAAQQIRRLGGNPADYRWYCTDINPLAAACSAANAITWGLANNRGTNVLIHCGDTLHDDGTAHELPVLREVLALHRLARRAGTLQAAANHLLAAA
ncbi:N-6 DNA methylase [Nocardia altamirensis]|uniref:N-6 DNA methylase n=1 Tax=Nocardia altamirensis TaxID=472158 RepID=UPI0008400DD3|nr:N-6 DNA methylase [Nocardia altamirensis]